MGAGGDPPLVSGAAAPTGDVTLVPLDGASASGSHGRKSSAADGNSPGGSGGSGPTASGVPDGSGSAPSDGSANPGRTHGGSPSPSVSSGGGSGGGGGDTSTGGSTTPGGSGTPGGPAALSVSAPVREATDKRWCEKVTVSFHNTGGGAARSGTVTFGTHIIGALGIDWATIESAEDLPVPIAAGATRKKTRTVCVDAWRVPLGMHIETRDVSVQGE
ncbi:hypothetical protein [Streptomyces avermitilis]|uniref:hypothetical protein n=1 Tax=Streptomyces avermitilis TaxID=33903 RepID=UPI0033E9B38B